MARFRKVRAEVKALLNRAKRRWKLGSGILLGAIPLFVFLGVPTHQQITKAQEITQAATELKQQKLSQSLLTLTENLDDFSDDGQQFLVYSERENKSHLYDLSGNSLADFEGDFRAFSEDEQQLVTYSHSEDKTRLYDLLGNLLADNLKGYFLDFSEDGQREFDD